MISTVDHQLFSMVTAGPGLDGTRLFVAVALARWAGFIAPALVMGLWLSGAAQDRASALAAAAAGGLALSGALILSPLIDMPRPFTDGPAFNYLDHVRDGSFPSDHATLLFAIAFALWVHRPPRWPLVWLPSLAVALVVSWARVFLDAHYPIDIAGGALIGAVAAASTATAWGRAVLALIARASEPIHERLAAGSRRLLSRCDAGEPFP